MTTKCPKCGGEMERGHTMAHGLIGGSDIERPFHESRLLFVVEGTPTSLNPGKAFRQGKSGEQDDRTYGIIGARCASCGLLEFYGEA
jgi:hypothetical protein